MAKEFRISVVLAEPTSFLDILESLSQHWNFSKSGCMVYLPKGHQSYDWQLGEGELKDVVSIFKYNQRKNLANGIHLYGERECSCTLLQHDMKSLRLSANPCCHYLDSQIKIVDVSYYLSKFVLLLMKNNIAVDYYEVYEDAIR